MTNEQYGMSGNPAHTAMCHKKSLCWSAIIAGALIGIGLSFLLNLFSIAIGLSLVTTKEGIMTLAIGGFIGLIIGTIASMFVGGYAAGFLGRAYCPRRNLGALYGFTAWSLALILTVLLAGNFTRYVSSYSQFVANPAIVVVTDSLASPTSNSKNQTSPVTIDSVQQSNNLGITSLLIFVLFFIGSLSSALGGHFGMTLTCHDDENCSTR